MLDCVTVVFGGLLVAAPDANFFFLYQLLAQPELSEISTHFRAGSDTRGVVPYLVLTIVPILAGVGLTALYQQTQGFRGLFPSSGPAEKLFAELCQAHQLTRQEIRLLRRMARMQKGHDLSSLFILQPRFEQVAAAYIDTLEDQTKTAAAIDSLRGRLFGNQTAETPDQG